MSGNFPSLKAAVHGPFWENVPMQPLQWATSASCWLIFVSPGNSVSPWEQHWRAVASWMFIFGKVLLSNASHLLGLSQGVMWVQAEQPQEAVFALWEPSWRSWLSRDSDYPLCIMYGNSPDFGRWTTARCYFCAGDSGFGRSIMFVMRFTSVCSGLSTCETFVFGFQETLSSSFWNS